MESVQAVGDSVARSPRTWAEKSAAEAEDGGGASSFLGELLANITANGA